MISAIMKKGFGFAIKTDINHPEFSVFSIATHHHEKYDDCFAAHGIDVAIIGIHFFAGMMWYEI